MTGVGALAQVGEVRVTAFDCAVGSSDRFVVHASSLNSVAVCETRRRGRSVRNATGEHCLALGSVRRRRPGKLAATADQRAGLRQATEAGKTSCGALAPMCLARRSIT